MSTAVLPVQRWLEAQRICVYSKYTNTRCLLRTFFISVLSSVPLPHPIDPYVCIRRLFVQVLPLLLSIFPMLVLDRIAITHCVLEGVKKREIR